MPGHRFLGYGMGLLQYLLPHHLLSRWIGRATRIRARPWKDWQIRWFIRRYRVDMVSAVEPDPSQYPDFNSFFTRALRPETRPVASVPGSIVSPVDGEVTQVGDIDQGTLLQAKGKNYSLEHLLGEGRWCALFQQGKFVTLYLSPRDYHRIHMPVTGCLQEMRYTPGRLFSVNPWGSQMIPDLLARNERVACLFETSSGPVALVLIGALFVGSIETVWEGVITPPYRKVGQQWNYGDGGQHFSFLCVQGQEVGRFNMGSAVVLLFPACSVSWGTDLRRGKRVVVGQQIGSFLETP